MREEGQFCQREVGSASRRLATSFQYITFAERRENEESVFMLGTLCSAVRRHGRERFLPFLNVHYIKKHIPIEMYRS